MKILWLSWRDIKNPASGGAEKVSFEICRRLARDGHKVTIFTSRFRGSKKKQRAGSVLIVRRGGAISCRFFAFLHYFKNRDFDLVVDEINTIPFFSILYARRKSIALIHQLAKEYWFYLTIFPFSAVGYFLEPLMLKLYRNQNTITVSSSTRSDLKKLGFGKVSIVREGLDFKPQNPGIKENLILFIGRLTAVKRPQDAIVAFSYILRELSDYKLAVIGSGEKKVVGHLKQLSRKYKISDKILFAGYIDEKSKVDFLKRSKVVLIPAVREGWNLVAVEAMALGCVPIGYNVTGLRDSIKNERTGVLTRRDPQALANAAIKLLVDDKRRKRLARAGFEFAKKFSWENTYTDFKKVIFSDKIVTYARTGTTKRPLKTGILGRPHDRR